MYGKFSVPVLGRGDPVQVAGEKAKDRLYTAVQFAKRKLLYEACDRRREAYLDRMYTLL